MISESKSLRIDGTEDLRTTVQTNGCIMNPIRECVPPPICINRTDSQPFNYPAHVELRGLLNIEVFNQRSSSNPFGITRCVERKKGIEFHINFE